MSKTYYPKSALESQDFISSNLSGKVQSIFCCGTNNRLQYDVADFNLSSQKLNQIEFFEPNDMVIGVQAGMTVKKLNQHLASENMYLPINPFYSNSTIGSVLSCNDSGASKLFMGGIRDCIIGISYVNGFGKLVKGGGKVVKNVTGYDLGKMMIGSKGAFGFITSINFKILPIAPTRIFAFTQFEEANFLEALIKLNKKHLPISSLQIVKQFDEQRFHLVILLEGNDAKIKRLKNEINTVFQTSFEYSENESKLPFKGLFEGYLDNLKKKLLRKDTNYNHIRIFSNTALFSSNELYSIIQPLNPMLIIHPFGGDCHLLFENSQDNNAAFKSIINHYFIKQKVTFDVYSGSFNLKDDFGRLPDEYKITQRLKSVIDPKNIFSSPIFL